MILARVGEFAGAVGVDLVSVCFVGVVRGFLELLGGRPCNVVAEVGP